MGNQKPFNGRGLAMYLRVKALTGTSHRKTHGFCSLKHRRLVQNSGDILEGRAAVHLCPAAYSTSSHFHETLQQMPPLRFPHETQHLLVI